MEIIGIIFTTIVIAVLIGAALFFATGFLMIFLVTGGMVAAYVMIREWWARWRFFQNAQQRERTDTKVIDVEYEDITKR